MQSRKMEKFNGRPPQTDPEGNTNLPTTRGEIGGKKKLKASELIPLKTNGSVRQQNKSTRLEKNHVNDAEK